MILKLKEDNAGNWGVVETHSVYVYKDVVNVSHIFNMFHEPMIFKGGFFQDLDNIPEKHGIKGYLKAKKPFYSFLDKSSCLVELKAKYKDGKLIDYSLLLLKPLTMHEDKLVVNKLKSKIPLNSKLLEILNECKDDREKFLKGRKEMFKDGDN